MPDTAARILAAITRPSYTPVKPKVLAKRMNITADDDYADFRRTLKLLIRDGRIKVGRNSVVRPADPHGSVVGIFRRTSAGLGIVRPHLPTVVTGAEIRVRDGKELDASTGDEVVVKIGRPAGKTSGATGQVVRVQQRATRTFVGTYFERDGEGVVRVDGTVFAHSVAVGDPGAKGARPGDKVVVEMLRFPTAAGRGEGVITEVLGPLSEPGVDLISVIRAFGLPEAFPQAALDEARAQADQFRDDDLAGRTDFTADCVVTIDPADARDFDDAVSVTIDPSTGYWVLTVHIADVAHFVRPGGALDAEARKRATSVYLPGRVIPMVPEVISNGLASLQEGKLRYVKTVRMEFTPTGHPAGMTRRTGLQTGAAEFFNGAIRVRRRFNYPEVSRLFARFDESPADPPELDPEVTATLKRMRELALHLRARRMKRGALELSMPAAELDYDADGRVTGAHFAVNDLSHQVIEEFMLAANEAVAGQFAAMQVHFLRRVHPAPNEEKLDAFADFARLLGYPLKRAQDRFELQRVLDLTADKPERAAVHFALLRSLKQAKYSPVQDEHYALASSHYCHFTSPIRRYPDLVVHRQLDRFLRTGKASGDEAELGLLGGHCSRLERRAEQAERELVKLKILQYLQTRIGTAFDAVITGVADYGFFAQADQFPAEGLVSVASLTDDYYTHDEASHTLSGGRTGRRYRLGDRVKVEVARVDVQKRHLDLRLTGDQPPQAPDAPRPRGKPPRLVRKNGKRRRGGD